jgi:hypothetical protein
MIPEDPVLTVPVADNIWTGGAFSPELGYRPRVPRGLEPRQV